MLPGMMQNPALTGPGMSSGGNYGDGQEGYNTPMLEEGENSGTAEYNFEALMNELDEELG